MDDLTFDLSFGLCLQKAFLVANMEELSRKSCKAMLIKLFQIINYDLKSRLKRQKKIITTRHDTTRHQTLTLT